MGIGFGLGFGLGALEIGGPSAMTETIDLAGVATYDYTIPPGATRVTFVTGPVVLPAAGRMGAGFWNGASLDACSGTQTLIRKSGGTHQSQQLSGVLRFALSNQDTISGTKHLQGLVSSPRDASVQTMFMCQGGNSDATDPQTDLHFGWRDAAADDDIIRFDHTAGGNFTSGKVTITAHFD